MLGMMLMSEYYVYVHVGCCTHCTHSWRLALGFLVQVLTSYAFLFYCNRKCMLDWLTIDIQQHIAADFLCAKNLNYWKIYLTL